MFYPRPLTTSAVGRSFYASGSARLADRSSTTCYTDVSAVRAQYYRILPLDGVASDLPKIHSAAGLSTERYNISFPPRR